MYYICVVCNLIGLAGALLSLDWRHCPLAGGPQHNNVAQLLVVYSSRQAHAPEAIVHRLPIASRVAARECGVPRAARAAC